MSGGGGQSGDKLIIAIVVILVLVACCICGAAVWISTGHLTGEDISSLLGMAVVGFMLLLMFGLAFINPKWLL